MFDQIRPAPSARRIIELAVPDRRASDPPNSGSLFYF